jgi:regulator of nucleoside diphosphate kinase
MTMTSIADPARSPQIVVGKDEHRKVTIAALTDVAGSSDHTDFLLYELDRAKVVPDALLPADVVRLGSMVRYEDNAGGQRIVKLVMPAEVDGRGTYRLSVTSSHGAALLGLRAGSSMTWLDPGGRVHSVGVLEVANPSD